MLSAFLFLIPSLCSAHVVINEVMWMGSDLSTADEWIELYNPDHVEIDLSGYTITSLKSTGQESVMVTFPSGSVIAPNEYIILSNKDQHSSRLAIDPFLVTTSISLPNTKLLIKLFDQSSLLIDTVDDAVGNPFAGLNPSGGVKASMERIDPLGSGIDASNWSSAIEIINMDGGANVLATPGVQNSVSSFAVVSSDIAARNAALLVDSSLSSSMQSSPASSVSSPSITSSLSSTSSSSLASSASSASSDSSPSVSPESSFASSAYHLEPITSECFLPNLSIIIQDGELTGIDKTTVNFQAVAITGSISDSTCHWTFSDGYTSESCNPPPHAFVQIGTTQVTLEAKNSCGTSILTKEIVLSSSKQASLSDGMPITYPSPFANLFLVSALPNPDSVDSGKESVIIKNRGEDTVHLSGWKLKIGNTTLSTYALTGDLAPSEERILFSSEMKISLPNSIGHVTLVSPLDASVSTIDWEKAEEGRRYYSADCRDGEITGTLVEVFDDGTLLFQPDLSAQKYFNEEQIPLQMIGALFSEENSEVVETIRALLKDQKVELQFDTELWSKEGKLQAYLSNSTMKDSAKELISIGLLEAEKKKEYKRRSEYTQAEKDSQEKSLGIWQESDEEEIVQNETKEKIGEDTSMQKKNDDGSKKEKKVSSKKAVKKKVAKKTSKKQVYYTEMYRKDLLAEQHTPTLELTQEPEQREGKGGLSSVALSLLAGIAGSFISKRWL